MKKFGQQDVRDAAEGRDEVEHIPRVLEVILYEAK